MKKYMIMAVMLFAQAQDVVCSARLGSFVIRRISSSVIKRDGANLPVPYTGKVKNFRDFQKKYPTTTGVIMALGVTIVGGFGVNELHGRTLGRQRQEGVYLMQQQILESQREILENQREILVNQNKILKEQRQQELAMATMKGQMTILGQLRCPKQNCPPCASVFSPGNER